MRFKQPSLMHQRHSVQPREDVHVPPKGLRGSQETQMHLYAHYTHTHLYSHRHPPIISLPSEPTLHFNINITGLRHTHTHTHTHKKTRSPPWQNNSEGS